ncbi:MAG: hypothetical protein J6C85_02185 [Alphaproteobacteria bacterium]|nr:hypothetical protein [Alphaproteobacteria bacterium]
MIKAFREHWFGIILSVMVLMCACFALVVGIAPHTDIKMRGFTPCTYTMAAELGQSGEKEVKAVDVMCIVGRGFFCYGEVMKEGMVLFLNGKQKTPWANYLFEPEILKDDFAGEAVEPFSQDLLEANLLNEDEEDFFVNDENKENDND